MARAAVSLLLVAAHGASAVELVTFDGAPATTFNFVELNDPVMGGLSTGTWALNATAQAGVFDGEVVDVPSLKAPGFIKAAADGSFPDASSAADGDLVLEVRTTTPEYEGFRVPRHVRLWYPVSGLRLRGWGVSPVEPGLLQGQFPGAGRRRVLCSAASPPSLQQQVEPRHR